MEIIRTFIRDRVTVKDCGHETACWLWSRCTRDGYGRAQVGGRTYQAHRVSFEAFASAIPDGFEVDHLCCVTNCVNPEHLEPVTSEENLRRKCIRRGYVIRGIAAADRRTQRPRELPTHCKHGHEYTPENTAMKTCAASPNPFRLCRACSAAESRKHRARKRAARQGRMGGYPTPSSRAHDRTNKVIARPHNGCVTR